MLTRKRYSFFEAIIWTRRELLFFFIYSLSVTAIYSQLELVFLRVPWTPVALIGTAVAFLIGFQNNAAYDRTWEARKIWGGIVNKSRTFAMMITDMVRDKSSSLTRDEIKEIHSSLILRHVAWLTALRHAMREEKPWEMARAYKTSREWNDKIHIPERENTLQHDLTDYLPSSELDYVLAKGNKSTTILYLQSRHLRKLKEQGLIWEFAFLDLEKVLGDLFDLQGKSERIKNFPYPRQYSTISHFFTWMFLLLLPFGIVPEFQKIGLELAEVIPSLEQNFIWGAIPFCTVVSWVFHTMERIGKVGENPFEGSPNDVPISTIARGIEIDLRQQLNDDQKRIPQPFPADHQVQM